MTSEQLQQYDHFLDENDWDIYYWATQEPMTTSNEITGGVQKLVDADDQDLALKNTSSSGSKYAGEWAQAVGAFRPAYRPVPARWRDSWVLRQLREHVVQRSADGINEGMAGIGGGLGRMPEVRSFDS
jgi:Flavinator of succinate dehydrogenase